MNSNTVSVIAPNIGTTIAPAFATKSKIDKPIKTTTSIASIFLFISIIFYGSFGREKQKRKNFSLPHNTVIDELLTIFDIFEHIFNIWEVMFVVFFKLLSFRHLHHTLLCLHHLCRSHFHHRQIHNHLRQIQCSQEDILLPLFCVRRV